MTIASGIAARLPDMGAASVGEVIAGVGVAERAILDAVGSARGSVSIEAICFQSDDAVAALGRTLDAGSDVTLLASHLTRPSTYDGATRIKQGLWSGRMRILNYDHIVRSAGVDPAPGVVRWQHSKLTAIRTPDGGREAWFSNVAPYLDSQSHADVAVRLLDDTARAAHDVLEATTAAARGGGIAPVGAAIDAAAGAGLLFNDALTGRRHFTAATDALVRGASERLLLVTKGLDDVAVADGLVAAAERGVRTGVVTKKLGRAAAARLEGSGVHVAIAPRGAVYDRTNLLIADDTGLLATGYHSREILRPDRDGMLAGRESAIVLRGDGLARMEAALQGTDRGVVGLHLVAPQPEPVRGWRALFGRSSQAGPASGPSAAYEHPAAGGRFVPLGHADARHALVDAIG